MEKTELTLMIEEMGASVEQFKQRYDKRVEDLEKIISRGGLGGGSSTHGSFGFSGQNSEYSAAFDRWARKGDESLKTLSPRASMREASDPDGGFVIPEDLDLTLDRLAVDNIAMRRIAQVKGGLRGDYKRPFNKRGATGGWVGESETRTETSTPGLTLFEPPWSEVYALPRVSQKLLDMAGFDIAAWLVEEIGLVESEMEGAAFIVGNGVKMPKGILSYDMVANASWEFGKIGYIPSGDASLLNDADKLIDLQHALKGVYRQNATWLMNDTTLSIVRKMKDGEGRYIWIPGLSAEQPDTLLGKPVEIDDNMPDIGSDEYPVVFGDFRRAYLIGDHAVGRRLIRDPYSEKGQVLFYEYRRVFGGVINFEAIKLLKISE